MVAPSSICTHRCRSHSLIMPPLLPTGMTMQRQVKPPAGSCRVACLPVPYESFHTVQRNPLMQNSRYDRA